MAETNLRQANALVRVAGSVSEKDLKFYKGDQEVLDESQAEAIKGSITVKTGETNFVRFNVNASKLKKDGSASGVYPGVLTIKNDYKSIADVGADDADVVSVKGDINLYQSVQSGENVIGYKSNFFNRVKNLDGFEPRAEFEIEMFISGMIPEVDKDGEETGRLKVNGVVPGYEGRTECITLIAPTDDGIADAIDSTFEVGQTVEFYGNVVNSRVQKITEIPVAIGKPKQKIEYENVNEMIITGASEPYEDGVSQFAPYDESAIKLAMQERSQRFEERKAKVQGGAPKTNTKASGQAKGRTLGF